MLGWPSTFCPLRGSGLALEPGTQAREPLLGRPAVHVVEQIEQLACEAGIRVGGAVGAVLTGRLLGLVGRLARHHHVQALSGALGPDTVLPTSILFDANGKEVWRYVGDLDWTGPQAAKLLGEAGVTKGR